MYVLVQNTAHNTVCGSTDWPDYNVRSQQTRRLNVQDDGLSTQMWTIRLFQIPFRGTTLKMCVENPFLLLSFES